MTGSLPSPEEEEAVQSGLRKMLSDETATSAGAVARQFSSDAGLATRSELRSILSIFNYRRG